MNLNSMIFTTLLSSLENRNSYNSNYLTGGKDILNQPGQDVETPGLTTSQPATEEPKPQQGVDTVTLTTAKSSLQNTLFTPGSTHLKNINALRRLSTAAIKSKTNNVLNYTDTLQNASTLFKKATAIYQQIQGKMSTPVEQKVPVTQTATTANETQQKADRNEKAGYLKSWGFRSTPNVIVSEEFIQENTIGSQIDIVINQGLNTIQNALNKDETQNNPIKEYQDQYIATAELNPLQEFSDKLLNKTEQETPVKEIQNKVTETKQLNGLEEFRDKFVTESTLTNPMEEYQDKFINVNILKPPLKEYQDKFIEKMADMKPLQEYVDKFIESNAVPNPIKEIQDKFISSTTTLNPMKDFQDIYLKTA